MGAQYPVEYYTKIGGGSRASASVIVPLVMEMLQPGSVVDVGCGTGAWAAAFKREGASEVLGIDGDYVDRQQLEIDPDEFLVADLIQPTEPSKRFDLAVSLEVAEHLDQSVAQRFVKFLTDLAPKVLFSAAIPGQGGEHHVNEQWPSYWVELFERCGFAGLDPFRAKLWQRPEVDWWYAQNLLLFVRREQPQEVEERAQVQVLSRDEILPLVHPKNLQQHVWQNRVLRTAIDLAAAVPIGSRLILADDERFGFLPLPGRTILPFIEREGQYDGPPRDDEHAIAELRRLRLRGANYLAVGWPSFWWLDHYRAFAEYLHTSHVLTMHNDDIMLFQLTPEGDPA